MDGENFVRLVGKITYPELKKVGQNNTSLFTGKLAIPIKDSEGKFQYLKVKAWGELSEALGDLANETFIKLDGHIEERSYDGKCKHCGGFDKKYWTEVIIDNFLVV